MSSTTPTPIQLHIPPGLSNLRIPLSTFLARNPNYNVLAVGACIFFPPHPALSPRQQQTPSPLISSLSKPCLLLVQRASTEYGFPDLWEIPGGSSEPSDPTILHSVAREIFEETGLTVCNFKGLVGEGVEFSTGRFDNVKKWLKLAFEVEVVEIPSPGNQGHRPAESGAKSSVEDISITLDPEEHQRYAWVTEEDVRRTGPGAYQITTEAQREMMLQAFALHNARSQQLSPLAQGPKRPLGEGT